MNLFVLFLLITFNQAFGVDVPDSCYECLEKESKIQHLSKITAPYSRLMFLEEKARALHDSQVLLRKDLLALARTLRDRKSEPTYEQSRKEIAEIKKDFDRLTLLQKESLKLEKQFNICITTCSAYRRSLIEQDIKNIQKLKTAILIKRPILANNVFEKRLSNLDDKFLDNDEVLPDDIFEKDLKDSLFDSLQAIELKVQDYWRFLNDGNKPFLKAGNEEYINSYLTKVTSRYPGVVEDVLKTTIRGNEITGAPEAPCFFAVEYKKYSDRKKKQELAIDGALFILPMLAGPLGAEAGLIVKDRQDLSALDLECKRKESDLLKNKTAEALAELKACREQYGEQLFVSNLSLIPAGSLPLKLASKSRPLYVSTTITEPKEITTRLYKDGISGVAEFKTTDKGVFTVMDLSTVKDPSMIKVSEDYWRYVGNVYNERLNISPEEIENFIKSSKEMAPRTTLIINTEQSAFNSTRKFNGGVGIVTSDSPKELLPLEKATGVRLKLSAGV